MNIRNLWNYFIKSYSYFHCSTKVLGSPEVYTLELTNRCIMNCRMCPHKYLTREQGNMDFDLYKKIVNQLDKSTHNILNLDGMGESFLHPNLKDFIIYARQKGFQPRISMNPVLLSPKNIQMVFDSGLSYIILALDGTSQETYEYFRGKNANYKKAVENINNMLEIKNREKRKEPHITLQMIQMQKNAGEVEEFRKIWNKQGVDKIKIKKFNTYDGSHTDIIQLADTKWKPNISKTQDNPCIRPWLVFSVLWDGRVIACCKDYDGKNILGDLKKESVQEVWNNPQMVKLREQMINKTIPKGHPCFTCFDKEGASLSKIYPLDILAKLYEIGIPRLIGHMFRNGK